MKKILVPLDGSALAEQALAVAGKMVDEEFSIILLRVVSPVAATAADFLVQEAKDYLDDICDKVCRWHPEAKVECLMREGKVADTIVELAEKEKAGLIVMTTHGAGGIGRWLMGSVAEKVVRQAPCPVLTIGRKPLEAPLD